MRKTFKQVVSDIKTAERDVDTVLEAAHLSRNPVDGRARLAMILETITAITGMIAGAAVFIAFMLIMAR